MATQTTGHYHRDRGFRLTEEDVSYGLNRLTDTQVTILTGWIGRAKAQQVGEEIKAIFRDAMEGKERG